jgi:hypothetical protein
LAQPIDIQQKIYGPSVAVAESRTAADGGGGDRWFAPTDREAGSALRPAPSVLLAPVVAKRRRHRSMIGLFRSRRPREKFAAGLLDAGQTRRAATNQYFVASSVWQRRTCGYIAVR